MEPFVSAQDIQAGIAEITFFHPAHNSLPSDLLKSLADTITATGERDEIQVIILKSYGNRTFCAGASFNELIAIDDFDTGKQFFMGFANVINACRKCPKIIIGRVQGKAVGGGVGLAAAVDYCLATKFASIKLSELAVGIGPFVVGPAVKRKLGLSAFSQMAMNPATFQSPSWAKDKGLYAEVFETTEELDQAVLALAEQTNSYNPEAAAEIKRMCWEGTEDWDQLLEKRAEISGRLVLSEYTKETLKRFAER
ncbi:MAG: enoyl-CoA hydratase/isomerase family protein [Saprospiraceae bacterium]|nr:enoyl-CoA hydratase/isomerase family protein [Saprospiraceae bacterium]